MIHKQAQHRSPFLLFISCNTDGIDAGEVKHTIENIRTELLRGGWNAMEVCSAYLNHPNDLVRLRIYVPYFVNQVAAAARYRCHSESVIAYRGNRGVQMLNYRLSLKPDQRTLAPRFPQEKLSSLINAPMVFIENGKIRKDTLGLPMLRVQSTTAKTTKPSKLKEEEGR